MKNNHQFWRKYDGKLYGAYTKTNTKKKAEAIKKRLKERNFKVRIVKRDGYYDIFRNPRWEKKARKVI